MNSSCEILYSDKDLIVAIKPYGSSTQGDNTDGKSLLELLQKKFPKDDIGLIHRLDKPVGGVIVFSKNNKALVNLNEKIKNKEFTKVYYISVYGELEESGVFEDYLIKMKTANMSTVGTKEKKSAKKAILKYKVIDVKNDEEGNKVSLVEVELVTGRHHQIRVQFSSRGLYILGDKKYKNNKLRIDNYNSIALWSYKVSFEHPIVKKRVTVKKNPDSSEGFSYFDFK